jgi:hypothetical protein
MLPDDMSADLLDVSAAVETYSHIPCTKGGPSKEDTALAAKIKGKLRGSLRGHLTGSRICCARQVVNAVKARRLPKRAAVIAVTTTIVESTILNINKEYDHDSLGLFQQRGPWGSRTQRLNPAWATNAFLNAMLRKYPKGGWKTAPIGQVCQRVQVSAFPERYQPQAADATIIVNALWGDGKAPKVALAGKSDDGGAALEVILDEVRGPTPETVSSLPSEAADEDGDGSEAALAEEVADVDPDAGIPRDGIFKAAKAQAARKVKVSSGVTVGPVGKLLVRILEHYPKRGEIYISSAYRNEPGSHHGGRTYRGSPTAAIDIGAGGLNPAGSRKMRDVAKWLYDNFAADTVQLIHTTPYKDDNGFYVYQQRKNPGGSIYGPQTINEHRDHVHFATSKALAEKILARLRR